MVTCDQYPYDRCMTILSACIDSKYHAAGMNLKERLKDPAFRAMLRKEMEDPSSPYDNYYRNSDDWGGVFIAEASENPEANGMFLSDYAAKLGKDPFEVYFDMLMNNRRVWAVYCTMCEEDQFDVIRSPYCVVGTDGINKEWGGKGHPRGSASFPQAIDLFVKKNKVLTLEQMIHKMTGLTAERLLVPNKGLLNEGCDADVLVMDYEHLHNPATYDEPNALTEGMDYVIVNGKPIIAQGQFTGQRNGRVLRHLPKQ